MKPESIGKADLLKYLTENNPIEVSLEVVDMSIHILIVLDLLDSHMLYVDNDDNLLVLKGPNGARSLLEKNRTPVLHM